MPTSPPRTNKSTNVRPIELTLLSAAVRGLGSVHPEAAARLMLRAFCTPRRPKAMRWDRGLTPELEWLRVDGEPIGVYRWGPSLNGKKVLLAHGWSGRAEQLRALVEPLRERGYAVYAFDQAGHGVSGGRISNIPRFARVLRAVAAHVGPLEGLVAHSLGASGAAFAIGQGLSVERLVMIAPPAHPVRYLTGFWRTLGVSDALGARMQRAFETQERFGFDQLELGALAAGVPGEVLVIHDRSDREVPSAEGVEWSRALGRAGLLTTDGLGHNRLLAAPAVLQAVTQFVGGEWPQDASVQVQLEQAA